MWKRGSPPADPPRLRDVCKIILNPPIYQLCGPGGGRPSRREGRLRSNDTCLFSFFSVTCLFSFQVFLCILLVASCKRGVTEHNDSKGARVSENLSAGLGFDYIVFESEM